MKENIIIRGEWYIKERPEIAIRGFLKYDRIKGVKLELEGSFFTSDFGLDDISLVFGNTEKGDVTLFNLFCIHRERSFNIYFESYFVNVACVGTKINDISEEVFHEGFYEHYGLQSYFRQSGLKINEIDGVRRWSIQYDKPESLIIRTEFGKFKLFHEGLFKGEIDKDGLENRIVTVRERFVTKLEFNKPLSLKNAIESSNLIDSLFSLLSNNIIYTTNVVLKHIPDNDTVKVYYNSIYNRNEYKNHNNNTVPISQIMNLSEIIKEWIRNYKKFEPILILRNQAIFKHNSFDENRFLDSVTALETFHRKFFNQIIEPDPEIASTIEIIFDSGLIHNEQLPFFKNRLGIQNQKSLLQRLMEILSSLPDEILTSICDDSTELAKRLRDSRNSFTHNSNRKMKSVLRYKEMSDATSNNEKLLDFLILKQLGIEEEILIHSMINNGCFVKINTDYTK